MYQKLGCFYLQDMYRHTSIDRQAFSIMNALITSHIYWKLQSRLGLLTGYVFCAHLGQLITNAVFHLYTLLHVEESNNTSHLLEARLGFELSRIGEWFCFHRRQSPADGIVISIATRSLFIHVDTSFLFGKDRIYTMISGIIYSFFEKFQCRYQNQERGSKVR